MSRQRSLNPTKTLNVAMPGALYDQLDALLYSELEQRVPYGAYRDFITTRLREYFTQTHLDLAPYLGNRAGVWVVSGTPEAIAELKRRLA